MLNILIDFSLWQSNDHTSIVLFLNAWFSSFIINAYHKQIDYIGFCRCINIVACMRHFIRTQVDLVFFGCALHYVSIL